MSGGAGWKKRARRAVVAGAVAFLGASPGSLFGQTTASWVGAVDGTWTDATKWSTNPTAPIGETFDAFLMASGAGHVVRINHSPHTINTITVDSDDVTLSALGISIVANEITLNRGLIQFQDTTLTNATVNGSGGEFRMFGSASTLDNVSLERSLVVQTSANIVFNNNLNLNGGTISKVGTSTSVLSFPDVQSITGSGQIGAPAGDGNMAVRPTGGGTLTLGSGIVTEGVWLEYTDGNIVNNGTLTSTPNKGLQITGGTGGGSLYSFINNGTITAGPTSYLRINGGGSGFFNNGVIIANGGTISIGIPNAPGATTFTTSQLGVLDARNGNILIEGVLENTGTVFSVTDATGSLSLFGSGTIRGGTIQTSGSAALIGLGGVYDGTALNGVVQLVGQDAHRASSVRNGLHLDNGSITLSNHSLRFDGTQTLDGIGTIFIDTGALNSLYSSGGVLTIAPGVRIEARNGNGDIGLSGNPVPSQGTIVNQGVIASNLASRKLNLIAQTNQGVYEVHGGMMAATQTFNQGLIDVNNGGILWHGDNSLNQGTIRVQNSTLNLQGTFTNQGTVLATNSIVNLRGTYSLASLGTMLHSGNMITIGGIMNNGGATLALNNPAGSWWLEGRVNGGRIESSDGAILKGTGGTLATVTLAGGLTVEPGREVFVDGGLTLDGGTVSLLGQPFSFDETALHFTENNPSIGGSGTIRFDGTGPSGYLTYQLFNPASLTIGSDIVVQTGTQGGYIFGKDGITNHGTISARTPGTVLVINRRPPPILDTNPPPPLMNMGTLEALNGATLSINMSAGELGTVVLGSGGAVEAAGTFAVDRSISVDTARWLSLSGNWTNPSAITVNGGTLGIFGNGTNSGSILVSGNGTLNLGRVPGGAGTLSVTDSNLATVATLTTSQVQSVPRSNSTVFVKSFLNNTGVGLPLDDPNGAWRLAGGSLSGGSLTGAGGPFYLVAGDAGTLNAVVSNTHLGVTGMSTLNVQGNWANNGTITVTNGGTLRLAGSSPTFGAIQMTDANLLLAGMFTTAQVQSIQRTNSPVQILGGSINNSASQFLFDPSVGPITMVSGTISGGSISTVGGGEFDARGGALSGVIVSGPIRKMDSGRTFTMAGSWNNASTITVDAGTLALGGTFASANIGTIVLNGGTVTLAGTLNNAGQTLNLAGPFKLGLTGGTVLGGTILGDNDASLSIGRMVNASTVTLNGVTLNTPAIINSNANLVVVNGLTFQNATLTHGFANADLYSNSTQSLQGNGTVIFEAGSRISADNGTLTIGPGVHIQTTPTGSGAFITGVLGFIVNEGTISQRMGGHGIAILGNGVVSGGFINRGVVEVGNGGSIYFQNGSRPLNYTNGVLSEGRWMVYGASTLMIGTFAASNPVHTNDANILLDGVGSVFADINGIHTNLGSFAIDHGRDFVTVGSLTNSGFLGIGTNSTMYVSGPLNNTGSIDLVGTLIVDYDPGESESLIFDDLSGQIGTQIFSSMLSPEMGIGSADNAELMYTTFGGQQVDQTSVLMMLTSLGDANLDGVTDLADYQRWLGGYGPAEGSGLWIFGDFDYSGAVNLDDFEAYLHGYYSQGGSMAAITDAVNNSPVSDSDKQMMLSLVATVPEPLVGGLIILAIPWSLRRPRRLRI